MKSLSPSVFTIPLIAALPSHLRPDPNALIIKPKIFEMEEKDTHLATEINALLIRVINEIYGFLQKP